MGTQAFFDAAAKTAVRKAIEQVESQTSAELVVTVRRQAGESYLEADVSFGAFVALLSLLVILFVDEQFALVWIPVDVVIAFTTGALFSHVMLRRVLTRGARREAETRRAACTAFHDLGVGRTSGRNGILVLVGIFERKVAVIADVSVDPAVIAPAIEAIRQAVDRSAPDFTAFLAGLEALGPILSKAMPRKADDVNELPDEMTES